MAGLAAFTASEIMVRSFYAMQDTRTPVLIACVAVVSNIGLGYLLLRSGTGLAGLALAFSIANTIEAVLLLVVLARRIGTFGREFWRAIGSMLFAGAACLIVLEWFHRTASVQEPFTTAGNLYHWPGDFLTQALWVAILGLIGLGVYAGLALALGIPEVLALTRFQRTATATQPTDRVN
jgi:putative peptidoglycan lipid II flippase